MLQRSLVTALLAAVFGASGPLSAQRPHVVLVSVDAGSQKIIDVMLRGDKTMLPTLERMRERGYSARGLTPPSISSTPVSHPTIFTGTWPRDHGISGVAVPGVQLGDPLISGFTLPTRVPRLWSVVEAAGRRVVCVMPPGVDGLTPETTCTETLTFADLTQRRDSASAPTSSAMARIDAEVGPSPGAPAPTQQTLGKAPETAYVDAGRRFADYEARIVRYELERGDWDLMIVYLPYLDNLEHRYLLTDPRQVEYNAESGHRREAFARIVRQGYMAVDSILNGWIAASPGTDFIVVGDHGMVPAHSTILLNNVLVGAGLRVSGSEPDVRAISSGGSAQIYVNSAPRFARGTVSSVRYDSVVTRVVRACRSLRDPRNGDPLLPTVATRSRFAALQLPKEGAGDVYLSAAPGWSISSRVDTGVPAIIPNTLSPDTRARVASTPAMLRFMEGGNANELSLGVHGYLPGDDRLQAFFLAIGPHVPRRADRVRPMIDVAPTVLRVLGLEAPGFMKGRAAW
ncbi:MAG: alkaline phosphatase family protein [Gemmatimonadaceae bacterium]